MYLRRVTNAVLIRNQEVLMLKKPKRNWYVAPGGKMEFGESIQEAAHREYKEETGLTLLDMKLSSVFNFVMGEANKEEWMLFTFVTTNFSGELLEHTPEGELEWVPVDQVLNYPMAEGDKTIIKHAISKPKDVLTGTFYYTEDFQLLNKKIDR